MGWVGLIIAIYYKQIWDLFSGSQWEPPFELGDPTLPYLGQALSGIVRSGAGASLMLVSAISSGCFISWLTGWHYANRREGLIFTAALGIGSYIYSGIALVFFGLYRLPLLRVLLVLPIVAAVGWWLAYGKYDYPIRLPALRWSRPRFNRNWLWIGCASLAVLFAFIKALAPEQESDALLYHLAYPRRYLEVGNLVDLPWDFTSLYPMTWELWFGFGLALTGQTTATLMHFACLPMTGLIVYEMTRRYLPNTSPWLATALFVSVPTVMWEAGTSNIDLALTFHVTLLIYALLRYTETSKRSSQWLWLATFNLGMALATKHLALLVLALVIPGLLLYLWRLERNWRKALLPVVVMSSVALLFPLPWYIRNYIAAGNPLFPDFYSLFGAPALRWDAQTERGLRNFFAHFGRERTFFNLLTLPWDMSIHATLYNGALGPLFLMLLPVLTLRRWVGVLPWFVAFVVGFIAFWASPISSFQMRFIMPITPILAILAALAFTRLTALARRTAGRNGVKLLAGGLTVLLVLNLPPFMALQETDRKEWSGWLTSVIRTVPIGVVIGGESREAFLKRTVESYGAWKYANQNLPEKARVLTWSSGDQFYTNRESFSYVSTYGYPIAFVGAGGEPMALKRLKDLGITDLLVDRRQGDASSYAVTGPFALANWYDKLYEDRYYILYRIRWETLDAQLNQTKP